MENTSGSEVRKRKVEEDQEKAGKEEKEYEGAEWRLRGWSLQLLSDGKGYSCSNLVFSSIPGEPVSSLPPTQVTYDGIIVCIFPNDAEQGHCVELPSLVPETAKWCRGGAVRV